MDRTYIKVFGSVGKFNFEEILDIELIKFNNIYDKFNPCNLPVANFPENLTRTYIQNYKNILTVKDFEEKVQSVIDEFKSVSQLIYSTLGKYIGYSPKSLIELEEVAEKFDRSIDEIGENMSISGSYIQILSIIEDLKYIEIEELKRELYILVYTG